MTDRVDILRHPVDLPPDTGQRLQIWLHANQLDPAHGWPLRIDWPQQGITYWPNGPDGDHFTQTIMETLHGRLWYDLADAGALWCADPDHDTPDVPDPVLSDPDRMMPSGKVPCPHLIGRTGRHLPAGPEWRPWNKPADPPGRPVPTPGRPADDAAPADFSTTGTLALAITTAISRAGETCEHPDPGIHMPIYTSAWACPTCSAVAVLNLLRTTLAVAPVAEQLRPAGHWVVGHGRVPAGDPRAHMPLPEHPGATG